MNASNRFVDRLLRSAAQAVRPALRTGLRILVITIPISLGVLILKLTGLLHVIALLCEPLFAWFGLPGESALVFVTAGLVNIYACIAVIETLGLTGRTITILALMCLISHNLAVETAVQKKTGTSFGRIIAVRLSASFAGAFALNLLLPADSQQQVLAAGYGALASAGLWVELKAWAVTVLVLCTKILMLITVLMMLQRILEEFGVIQWISRFLKYPLMVFGLPHPTAFLWIVANTLGLAYGAGVIIDHVERGRLDRNDADILNYHIAVSHSLLEDTLLFVAIGAAVGWITIPRVILAGIVVWIKRLVDRLRLRGRNPLVP
jgi:spore maturation protein SpmB